MDRNTGRGPPERNRQRRPWRSWELWRPWRCRELWRPWQVVFDPPHSRNPFYPPQNFPGVLRGYQEPSGAVQTQKQDRTHWNKTVHRNRKPSWASSEAEASYGHDQESGDLTGSLSDRLHFCDKGGRRLEWPPRLQQEEPPAPDESPWTRPTRLD